MEYHVFQVFPIKMQSIHKILKQNLIKKKLKMNMKKNEIPILEKEKGQDLYIDIETDIESLDIRCFAFNFGNSNNIYVVPVLDIEYKPAYEEIPQIFIALYMAFYGNTVIAHNVAVFD